ncbi:hypothetical protein [Candidatus Bodocaedibacter vickermanii]|uniref:Uncharacterized protein n=1 Tax=Candidatus Bodocaedibacter vickermanii TaxID=2741701 RepID=A0A7L9RRX7_9PROT|nr:hypothetical protein CPBP_00024 [Candidatus Paracaedibacteraceae bacterium 'Lake Konstanz']
MKQTFLILVFMCQVSSAATKLTVEDGQILSATYQYMSQTPLPDGMSVFGNPCPGSKPFDFEHMSDSKRSCFDAALELSKLLRRSESYAGNREERLEAIKKSYSLLVAGLYNLTPSAIRFFQEVLENSTVYKTPISIPKQPERAANYNKIANWKIYKDTRPDDAFEAIRIERERLDAIAVEEEAKRKADARIKAALTTRHHTHHESDDEHASARDRLLPRGKLKAH